MYGRFEFYDHDIVAINKSEATILVRKGKDIYTIDLKACSENFKNKFSSSSGRCVGDRNIENMFFSFCTSRGEMLSIFKKLYIFNMRGNKLLFGDRIQRFHQLQKIIGQLGFSTYDLT